MLKVAILDDYSHVALESADWSLLEGIAEITVFDRHLSEEEAVQLLQPFDVLCTMRERMALPVRLLEALGNLKMVAIVGMSLANLDMAAATERGILVVHSPDSYGGVDTANSTPELTWGLMLATVRNIAREDRRVREGGWQESVGIILAGRTLGLLGLGKVGRRVAEYGKVFGMEVIAWSQNLTAEAAAAGGARLVDKEALFRQADVVSIHMRLSERSRGLVSARELGLMRPEAYLVNTSRGPIVDEAALIDALREQRIAGAGLDVFDHEPLPAEHPFRSMDNVTLTPHLGYVTRETLRSFYGPMPEAVAAFAAGAPIRVANPEALGKRKG